jgi:[histone H3]-lysine36 N-dimethyltransferase NSD2
MIKATIQQVFFVVFGYIVEHMNDESPCSPKSNCLNRELMIECNASSCPNGKNCLNQQFEKRDYPEMTVRYTADRGWGLIAKQKIIQGAFVIEYVGELIDKAELELRMQSKAKRKEENYYFLTLNGKVTIDAGPKGKTLDLQLLVPTLKE